MNTHPVSKRQLLSEVASRALLAWAPMLLLGLACVSVDRRESGPELALDSRALAHPGVVVSEHPLATRVGIEILEQGGNAADAAVATALALAVVYPQAGNLGGGGFALWASGTDAAQTLCFDFRETAPRNLVPALFLDDDGKPVPERSLHSRLAVGVPGSPGGLWRLHQRCGSLVFADVARPAIELARSGFAVDAWLAYDLTRPSIVERLLANPAARALFYPGGQALREGETLRQPQLARTLELFARQGPSAIYTGEVAAAIVADMQQHGGVLSANDLAQYEVREREPLRGMLGDFEILSMPPPSSGGLVLLQVLSILDGFGLEEERLASASSEAGISSQAVHWWIEAMRCAFSDRVVHMGDPEFWDVPVESLLSTSWAATRRASIASTARERVEPMPRPLKESGETTHLSVIDRDGNAVSMTTTLNTSFGSGVLIEAAGFLLNNEMDDFSILPGVPNTYGLVGGGANQLAPLHRPLSSMTPTIVRDQEGEVLLVLGSPGGPRIITAVIQVLLRIVVYGQGLEDAIRAPRLHQQYAPHATKFERGWPTELLRDLGSRQHEIEEGNFRIGSVQAILVGEDGSAHGFSDPRRGGAAGTQGGGVAQPASPKSGP